MKTAESRQDEPSQRARELESLANQPRSGVLGEFVYFLRHNKKWWLTPIIVILLLIGLMIVLAGTGAAPFIYPFL